jgi:allophanate hydrolase subunit 2
LGVVPPAFALPAHSASANDKVLRVRVLRAGEYDLFSGDMQERFWITEWKITHQSDRGGYRLAGGALKLAAPVEMRSYGLVAGIVQVPPSGEPIIQLSDANTAGGYPKIATVIEADLWRLGQARLGSFIKFEDVTYEEAVEAMAPIEAYVGRIRRTADLYRSL